MGLSGRVELEVSVVRSETLAPDFGVKMASKRLLLFLLLYTLNHCMDVHVDC